MDLRTFAERIRDTGRAMSPSALSKIENGERRVDVDDLTVFAYILQTTPATLLTPPEGSSTAAPSGVPDGRFNAEEIQMWIQGSAKLTIEDLVRYWKEQYFHAASYARRAEDQLNLYDQGQVGVTPREVYEEQLSAQRTRLDEARGRIFALDPNATLTFE